MGLSIIILSSRKLNSFKLAYLNYFFHMIGDET